MKRRKTVVSQILVQHTADFTSCVVEGVFDEAAYFKTRPGLWVDPGVKEYVSFTTKSARGPGSLSSYVLERSASEADIFGQPGSVKRTEVLAGATDLSQIASLIDLQSGGISGKLMNSGRANFFAVIGKNDELCVFHTLWDDGARLWSVICYPWYEQHVVHSNSRIFTNKF